MSEISNRSTLQRAIEHHQAGRLPQAEALYREILVRDPGDADALHLLGVVALQVGRRETAVDLIRQAIARSPQRAEFHSNLGEAYRGLGRLDEAVASLRRALTIHPEFSAALNCLGVVLAARHEIDEAQICYEQALRLDPNYAEAHHNLGKIFSERGQPGKAQACFQRALALRPNSAEAHNGLGNALLAQDRLDDAVAAYRQALSLKPCFAEAHNNLGSALIAKSWLEGALASVQEAIVLQPEFAAAHYNLGYILARQGKSDKAEESYRRAITLMPDYPEAHHNLGNMLMLRGQLEKAESCFRRALALRPHAAEIHYSLGNVLLARHRPEDAAPAYGQALALNSGYADAHNNLGSALSDQGRFEEACASIQRAIALRPEFAAAHHNLGFVLTKQGRLDAAVEACQRAIALSPGYADAHNSLGGIFKALGRLDEALGCYRKALALQSSHDVAHSNLILALLYQSGDEAGPIETELRRWNQQHAVPLAARAVPLANDRSPGRRLRLGYLSNDLRLHPVAYFLLPLLEAHDREKFHVTCYCTNSRVHAVTRRFQACADEWRSLAGATDEDLARQIRADGIDLLIDLAGHTGNNRLLVFARKPAPIQVSYLGFPAATGLDMIDYRLTDRWADPANAKPEGPAERLVRLPETAWCFAPLSGNPPVAALPVLERTHLTFGCFNNFAKVSERILQLWVRILQRLPGSRLILKNTAVGNASAIERLQSFFQRHGIDPARLELVPRVPLPLDHLQCYDRVDIALDTFPYHGTTTTCEALWMGVPVITLGGPTHVSRVGVSLLTNVGLPECVTQTPDAYVETAVALAGDLTRLAGIRTSLRDRMLASPLMDAPRFARHVESAYRTMWQKFSMGA